MAPTPLLFLLASERTCCLPSLKSEFTLSHQPVTLLPPAGHTVWHAKQAILGLGDAPYSKETRK